MSTFVLNVNDDNRDAVKANAVETIDALSAAKPWSIKIEPYRKEKTNDQNAALWGLAYKILGQELGEDVNVLHEYWCGEFWGWVEVSIFGKKKLRPARTTTTGYRGEPDKVKTDEFARFFDFIQRRSAENGIHIPDPDPLWRRRMDEAAFRESTTGAKAA